MLEGLSRNNLFKSRILLKNNLCNSWFFRETSGVSRFDSVAGGRAA